MKLYLIRHGQSTHNANLDIPHNPDPPLTDLGQHQAQATADYLASIGFAPDFSYVSPQTRALQTAYPIVKRLGLRPTVLPDICETGGLREHTGLRRSEIEAMFPEVVPGDGITEAGWWHRGYTDEAEQVFYARAAAMKNYLIDTYLGRGATVLLVTHGRFGSALVTTLLGLSPAGYSRYPFDNCGITRIDFDPHDAVAYGPPPPEASRPVVAIRLMFHNDNRHIAPELRS